MTILDWFLVNSYHKAGSKNQREAILLCHFIFAQEHLPLYTKGDNQTMPLGIVRGSLGVYSNSGILLCTESLNDASYVNKA